MNERSSIVPGISAAATGSIPRPEVEDYPQSNSTLQVLFNYALVGVVGLMAVITFILGIVRAFQVDYHGGTYFMLAVTHLLLVFLESFLIFFVRHGALEGDKGRSFYAIGALTLLHAIFTDVALYD